MMKYGGVADAWQVAIIWVCAEGGGGRWYDREVRCGVAGVGAVGWKGGGAGLGWDKGGVVVRRSPIGAWGERAMSLLVGRGRAV